METSDEELEDRTKDAARMVIKDGILGKSVSSEW